ncbi:hypothetical protein CRE_12214 [Caenorhabditis remanei]|uniref:F-box domain-containing protein n=1 Tax=Caenorhabditis remanei TaxID=31234 RepID=E3N0A5_CAERE|nr:hypothetical protein CRE_12214 [Caenorhabditis remanei]
MTEEKVEEKFKPFHLVLLPVLAREKALKFLDPIDLFEISLCSKRMTSYVRALRIQARHHSLILAAGQFSVSVHFQRKRPLFWDFNSFFSRENMTDTRTIGGIKFDSCERSIRNTLSIDEFYCEYPEKEIGVTTVSKHFQTIFHGPLDIVVAPYFHEKYHILFSEFKKCQELEICGTPVPSLEAMHKIFGEMKVTNKLVLRPETVDEYIIETALDVEELNLRSATWMKREHLLRLNCKSVQIFRTNFTSEDLEAFAENWMRNKKSVIERIRFDWNSGRVFRFHMLNAESWDSKKREMNYMYENDRGVLVRIDCSEGFDMERDDGLIGTFVLETVDNTQYLYFLVWRERFPERKRIEELPAKLAPFYKQLVTINKNHPDATSFERLLSNPDLTPTEFMETYRILRNMDAENTGDSLGKQSRRYVFNQMKETIVA